MSSAAFNTWRGGEHTFPVNPCERPLCLPFLVDVTFGKPSCRPFVMRITRDVVIDRRIRRRKPLADSFLQVIAYGEVLASPKATVVT
jgi:hypothetical protein